ncbi:MAG: T9SS type A sorting domain-containing protein [Balneolaceae bacterium]|nr:T9SS type A sorting domain-containing protein [Balneolaceae bacterium]
MQVGKSVPLSTDMQYEFTISQAAKAPTDPFSMLREDLRMKDAGASRFVITTDQVLETGGPELPLVFNLAQNYPNPFNPSTIISYELPETSDVRLEVFDLTGRQIATLVEGQVQAGSHRVTFDAGNLSSGVYLYRLQAGNQIFTRKLTLIK